MPPLMRLAPRLAWVRCAAASIAAASIVAASLVAASLVAPPAAHGAEGTEIASALDEHDPFDFYFGVDYAFEAKRAAIKREYAGLAGSTVDGPIPIVKDLVYEQNRHVLTPHLQVGIFQGLQLSLALPIIVNDSRTYRLDQRADPCVFPNDPQMREPTCIDRSNSSTLQDNGSFGPGLLPGGAAGDTQLGYDAGDPTTNFALDSKTVFKGVDRAGLDQIWVGMAWAPMRQETDDTKPNWVIGVEGRFSIGKIMKFDRLSPGSEDGVSRGVHEVKAYTSMSRRTTWAEPFVTFWWLAPFSMRGTEPPDSTGKADGSLWWDVGYGQENIYPQQQAGTSFGVEAIPWEDVKQKQKLAIEFRGRVEAHFEGRGYSEMWEVFSYAGDAENNPSGPLVLDRNPTGAGEPALSHPGITEIENYMTFAGRLGLRGWVGERAKFSASFELVHDQQHRISWTDAGRELPGCTATRTTGCETPNDDVISPGTVEENPLHKRVIDVVGRRYLVDESTTYVFMVSGTITF